MLHDWLEAIEDLIVTAPGNDDEEAGELWDSTVTRLGVDDEDEAKERVHFDLFESEDLAPERPFFVIVEAEAHWSTPGTNAMGGCQLDVFWTERAYDPDAYDQDAPVGEGLAHKRSKLYFTSWINQVMANIADRKGTVGDEIKRIELWVPPQRTPREQRDPDDVTADYWWTCWRFTVGAD